MKDFDPNAKCPKCGHDNIIVFYMQKRNWLSMPDSLSEYGGKRLLKEHLKRTCIKCNFSWPENIIKEILNENN